MIYEERRTVLKRGALPEYRQLMLDHLWPLLVARNTPPLCLLSGLIGMPVGATSTFVRYGSLDQWEATQRVLEDGADQAVVVREALARRRELIAEEEVRLWRACAERPKPELPATDRRAVYGLRRFTIHAQDWPEFVRHSATAIWPRIEAQGACILGLFRDMAATEPLRVTLLTGYHGPGHWEETRGWQQRPEGIPEELWERSRQATAARNAITLDSHVCLMTAYWPGV